MLPNHLVIKYFTDFCICYFKDINHDPEAPPHFYVNVPINDDSSLLLCIITSQIENKENYYAKTNKKALKSLVYVDNESLSFLSMKSIVNCNNAELINKIELQKRIDPKYKFVVKERNIPDHLKTKIVKAIQDSPLINKYIKKMLKS